VARWAAWGERIAALPVIAALGKNTSWGADIESQKALFLPRGPEAIIAPCEARSR